MALALQATLERRCGQHVQARRTLAGSGDYDGATASVDYEVVGNQLTGTVVGSRRGIA